MAHTIEVPDERYEKLLAFARKQQQTPEALFHAWAVNVTELPDTPQWGDQPPPTEEELQASPFLRMIGSLSVGDPRLAIEFDDVLAEAIADGDAEGE